MREKHILRDRMKAVRLSLAPAVKKAADNVITQRVLAREEIQNARVVCIYESLPSEVDTKEIIKNLLSQGKEIIIPPKNPEAFVQKENIDVFVVPGVAFDRQGNRLGRGGGYYDRVLSGLSVPVIGLAYEEQIVPRLQPEKYDIPVTTVITQKRRHMKQQHPEYQYLNLMKDIMENGTWKESHSTGVKLKSVFGRMCRYDLSQGFPLLTTKKVFTRGIIHELLWFLSGDSNIKYLIENNVHIWDEWAYMKYEWAMKDKKQKPVKYEEFIEKIKTDAKFLKAWGDLGPVYGVQWRKWPVGRQRTVDQLGWAIEKIKKYPMKKHYIISAWNAGCIYEMSGSHDASMVIAPCHTMFHINITGNKLSLLLYQRSADLFLGVPFNIASYALLTMMLAQVTGYEPGEFVHAFGDVHIYENHFEQAKEQLSRKPRPFPVMKINPAKKNIDKFTIDDFVVEGYDPHPPIKGDITVVGGF